jgi:hypothetical protein
VQRAQHLLAPAPAGDVQQQRAGGVGDVGGVLSGEPEPDVVLGQGDARDLAVGVGLVVAQPQQLGRREAGQRAVAGQRDQLSEPDGGLDLLALGLGALIVPQDRGTQHAVFGVQRDQPVHLAAQADAGGVADGRGQLGQDGLGGAPPVPGVLLRPAGARGGQGVLRLDPSQDPSIRVDRQPLGGRGPDVDAHEYRHVSKLCNAGGRGSIAMGSW